MGTITLMRKQCTGERGIKNEKKTFRTNDDTAMIQYAFEY